MNIESIKRVVESQSTMITALGIEFQSTPEPDTCCAVMPVNERTCQPYGILSGGASLAMAETLAGVASQALCPDMMCMGINVTGQHVKAVKKGHSVKGVARLVHCGHTLHVWQVTVTDEKGDTVSNISVTNFIKSPKEEGK